MLPVASLALIASGGVPVSNGEILPDLPLTKSLTQQHDASEDVPEKAQEPAVSESEEPRTDTEALTDPSEVDSEEEVPQSGGGSDPVLEPVPPPEESDLEQSGSPVQLDQKPSQAENTPSTTPKPDQSAIDPVKDEETPQLSIANAEKAKTIPSKKTRTSYVHFGEGFSRAAGKDRYETAALNAMRICSGGCDNLFIASGTAYSDGLAASALAVDKQGALLLTSANALPKTTYNAIKKISPKNIYISGGPTTVSRGVERSIRTLSGVTPKRFSGKDRYETAARIAKEYGKVDQVFLTTGDNWPDALAAAPTAGLAHAPLILAKTNVLEGASRQALRSLKPKRITTVGGSWTSQVAEMKALTGGATIKQLSGSDRYATAISVAKSTSAHPRAVVLATGLNFADAISGAAVAGASDVSTPIILTQANCVSPAVSQYMKSVKAGHFSGGPNSVPFSAKDTVCHVNASRPQNGGGTKAPGVTVQWLQEFRTMLDSLGGQDVRLEELTTLCAGVSAAACASAEGKISIERSQQYGSNQWKWHLVTHEYAHIYQFRQWAELHQSNTYKTQYGDDIEQLANCMATVKGHPWTDYRCSAGQLSYAKKVWEKNA